MPIPTDTFWNIKRLNIVFALSSLALLAVTAWAIVQDYGHDWRKPQKQARVWESALVEEKIKRELTPEETKAIANLEQQIADTQKQLHEHNKSYQDLEATKKQKESDRAALDFKLSNLKSTVGVFQTNLQDAIASEDKEAIDKLKAELEAPQKELNQWLEDQFKLTEEIRELTRKMEEESAQLIQLKKQYTEQTTSIDALRKKKFNLDPSKQGGLSGLMGGVSSIVRDIPLMGFVNPSEKPQQIVLPDVQTDVAFMKITTIDRCTTCHVNIANKDYTAAKVVAYLEEQVATARQYNLPEKPLTGPAAAIPTATAAKPGAVAAADFWHNWALKLSQDTIRKNNVRLGVMSRSVGGEGKSAQVSYDGTALTEFAYNLAATDANEIAKQNDVLLALIDAYCRYNKTVDVSAARGKARVSITTKAPEPATTAARNAAMKYAEEVRTGLLASLDKENRRLLEDRYRVALTDELNIARKRQSLPALDASPVLLAHPQLDLYVDVDSPHSFEAVGCSSCHDGSGQETDFVVAAHSPRDIWVDSRTGVPVLHAQMDHPPAEHPEHHDFSSMLEAAEQAHGMHFESAKAPTGGEEHHGESKSLDYVDPATGKRGKAVKQMDYWVWKYEPNAPRSFELVYHEWDWPMRTPQYIEANCARCHTEVYDIKETAPVLYEGRQLFTQLGCVNCHQMDSIPLAQNRKVGTDLRHVTAKLSPAFINTWIWAPKAFRPTTKMPHFFMLENNSSDEEIRRTRQEARAITEYLVRTATPLPPLHPIPTGSQGSAEAGKNLFNAIGCLGCHQNLNERGQEWITTDLVKRAGRKAEDAKAEYDKMNYNERQLYVQQHLAEPAGHNTKATYADGSAKPVFVQVGPELSGIGTKLLAGRTPQQAQQWLFDWLMEPRHYSDYTFMPRLRLNTQQAMDLIAYLLDQKRTTSDPKDTWKEGLAALDSAKLIQMTALQLKSQYSWSKAMERADDDMELTKLATSALPTEQAKAEVAKMDKDTKRLVFLGQKLIAGYGCMSCHAINGMETASSPCTNLSDWGQKAVSKLDFGYLDHHKLQSLPKTSSIPMVNGLSADAANLVHEAGAAHGASAPVEVGWPEVGHHRNEWITQKLKNPRVYDRGKALLEPRGLPDQADLVYDKLKMPAFYLNEEQVHAIVTFVISNRDKLITERLLNKATNPNAITIARGRELTERYNCVSCHQIEKNAPQVQQYFKVEDVITKAPPPLRGEGNKIQHGWLFNFFKHVEPLRPLLGEVGDGIRMPSFANTDDEWTAIIAYFNAVSKKESVELKKKVDPVIKYISNQRKATTQPTETTGEDWWQRPELAPSADYLKSWGLTFGHIKPIEVAQGTNAADLTKAYRTLLFKAIFTQNLYDAPYPFVDAPRPELSEERFALGQQFFYDMQCLKCHVLGDPNVAGANKAPTAPNLSLASRRLQQRWVRRWVQEPNIIQVGTAMPPFFTGLPVFNVEGQPWHLAQPLGDPAQQADHVKQVEAKYGATVQQQTDLLLDFLYAAGVRGITGVQPATASPPSQPAPASQPQANMQSAQ
jgi:cytochrome c551/c552